MLHFSDAARRQEKIIAFQWTHAHENKPKCTAAKKNPVCHTSYLFGFGELRRAEPRKARYTALSHHLKRPPPPRASCRLVRRQDLLSPRTARSYVSPPRKPRRSLPHYNCCPQRALLVEVSKQHKASPSEHSFFGSWTAVNPISVVFACLAPFPDFLNRHRSLTSFSSKSARVWRGCRARIPDPLRVMTQPKPDQSQSPVPRPGDRGRRPAEAG